MGIRDRIGAVGRQAANALLDVVEDSLWKAKVADDDDEDQPEEGARDEGQDRTPGGAQADTADNTPVPTQPATDDPKSLFWDPFAIIEQLGYREKPTSISYWTLRRMLWKMPIVQAIIQTRIGQVASFVKPARDRYDIGFKLKLRDYEQTPKGSDKKWIQQMTTVLERTGVTDNPRGRDGFEAFLRKFMFDSLVYDQGCFEVVPNRKGEPAEWYAVDASTIRLADSASAYMDEDIADTIRYVQIYDGMIITEYTQEQLCFGVRNPRTDIRSFGYGVSELEMLITTVTALLNAWEYNQKAFTQGSIHKGILNFKGAIPEKQLKAFRRQWYEMLSGVENAWRTPITNADDMQWVAMHSNNRDMEYNAWFDFLIKVACSVYLMDPVEVNFKYGNVGQKSGLAEAGNKEKVIESKDRGLKPLLRYTARCMNQYIIWPLNENFELEYTGLDAETREHIADRNTKLVKTTRTIDELRAEDDLAPLPNGEGEIILDPVYLQNKQAAAAAEAGEEGGFPGGEEGGDEDFDFEKLLSAEEGKDEEEGEEPEEKEGPEKKGPKGLPGGPGKPPQGKPPKEPGKVEKSLVPARSTMLTPVKYLVDIQM